MSYHVLPTLPEPETTPHDHEMPHDVPSRYDEVPPDIGTGQAGFLLAVLVLAATLAMGLLAISQLKGSSLAALSFDRAAAAHMEAPGTPGTLRATPVSGTDAFFQR
ncbi:MAG: hypothetical protein Q8N31_02105 [Reyranella sp.]|nr:hypothetical protein [Reyranella sp.]MDP3158783.1 hypothetical protein [Reyranella sp.]